MQVDDITIKDLSIYNQTEESSIFHHFDYTNTNDGKYYLHQIFSSSLNNLTEIEDMQQTLMFLENNKEKLITKINNGALMVIEKFYETAIDDYPSNCNPFSSYLYAFFSKSDYSLTTYSLEHFYTFLKGILHFESILKNSNSQKINNWIKQIQININKHWIAAFCNHSSIQNLTKQQTLFFAKEIRNNFKQNCKALIEVFCQIDAHLGIVIAKQKHQLNYPKFIDQKAPLIKANLLHHLLVKNAVAYDVNLNEENNFMFLTGANMAGKSTFIKALGVAVYLANLGLPVPAKKFELTFFDGMLSNINVIDNIFKNESYFFNEVQRIKRTVEILNKNKNWLILIDELFKGTNIQDAIKCSTSVIKGLQKKSNGLFVLSTHLYEIANELKEFKNIQFKYFQTSVVNSNLQFSYILQNGVSNDKLGYLILENEGVVDMLK